MTSDFDTQKHDSDTSLTSDRTTQKTTAELIALKGNIERIRIEYGTYVVTRDSCQGATILGEICELALKAHEQAYRLAELQELNESLKLANSDAQHRVRQLEAALVTANNQARNTFAAAALTGMLCNRMHDCGASNPERGTHPDRYAKFAVEYADAMVKALQPTSSVSQNSQGHSSEPTVGHKVSELSEENQTSARFAKPNDAGEA